MGEFEEMSLYGMLILLDNHDSGISQMTAETIEDLNKALLNKVDSWRFYLDKLEDDAARAKKYAAEHMEASRVLLAQRDRAETRLVQVMNAGGFTKLQGKEFALSLRKSQRVEIDEGHDPTDMDQTHYPELVKAKYSWSKEALKRSLEAGNCPLSFVKVTEHQSPIFKARKE